MRDHAVAAPRSLATPAAAYTPVVVATRGSEMRRTSHVPIAAVSLPTARRTAAARSVAPIPSGKGVASPPIMAPLQQ
jgi:hypothetical protein